MILRASGADLSAFSGFEVQLLIIIMRYIRLHFFPTDFIPTNEIFDNSGKIKLGK